MGIEGIENIVPSYEPPIEVKPKSEPAREPSDPHQPPLDDVEDSQHLDEYDARRLEADKWREGARQDLEE
jgi:hypothetical protein